MNFVYWYGVFMAEDFDCDDEGEADDKKEDAWAMDGGSDVVECRHDDVDGFVKIEQRKKGCGVYEVENGLLHTAVEK